MTMSHLVGGGGAGFPRGGGGGARGGGFQRGGGGRGGGATHASNSGFQQQGRGGFTQHGGGGGGAPFARGGRGGGTARGGASVGFQSPAQAPPAFSRGFDAGGHRGRGGQAGGRGGGNRAYSSGPSYQPHATGGGWHGDGGAAFDGGFSRGGRGATPDPASVASSYAPWHAPAPAFATPSSGPTWHGDAGAGGWTGTSSRGGGASRGGFQQRGGGHVARGGFQQPQPVAMRGGPTGRRPPCRYFFSQGNCRFGDSCKFSHDPADAPGGGISVADEVMGGSPVSSWNVMPRGSRRFIPAAASAQDDGRYQRADDAEAKVRAAAMGDDLFADVRGGDAVDADPSIEMMDGGGVVTEEAAESTTDNTASTKRAVNNVLLHQAQVQVILVDSFPDGDAAAVASHTLQLDMYRQDCKLDHLIATSEDMQDLLPAWSAKSFKLGDIPETVPSTAACFTDEMLFAAVLEGDANGVKVALKSGANRNAKAVIIPLRGQRTDLPPVAVFGVTMAVEGVEAASVHAGTVLRSFPSDVLSAPLSATPITLASKLGHADISSILNANTHT